MTLEDESPNPEETINLPEINERMDMNVLADKAVSVLQNKTKLDLSRESAPDDRDPIDRSRFKSPYDFGKLLRFDDFPDRNGIEVVNIVDTSGRHVVNYDTNPNVDNLDIRISKDGSDVYIFGTHLVKGVNYAFTLTQREGHKNIELLKDGKEIQSEGLFKKTSKNEIIHKHLTAILQNVPTL